MYRVIILVGIVIGIIYLVVKLVRSPKFDKFCKDLSEGKVEEDVAPKETIKEITQAEIELNRVAKENQRKAEKLTAEGGSINKFLEKRGVVKPKKEDS
jgi:hypothetical protein